MLPSNHVPPPSSVSTSLNYIYDIRSSESNMDSEYSQLSSGVSEIGQVKMFDESQKESYEQVFGRLGSLRISDAKSAFEQSNLMFKDSVDEDGSQGKSTSIRDGSVVGDMQPEVGSRVQSEAGESGNEADVETDFITLSTRSRVSAQRLRNDQNQREFARAMSERLVQGALLAGSKDNVTVMIILLPGCETC